MDRKDLKKYFDFLEIDINASIPEIRNAYTYLKTLYSGNSLVVSSIQEEFNENNRKEILGDIEMAYQKILKSFEAEKQKECMHKEPLDYKTQEALNAYISQLESYSGESLRHIRELHGLDLKKVAQCTNISRRYLQSIEEEDFSSLPQKVYLKGFIVSYADHLNLDSQAVAEDMMKKYEIWFKACQNNKYDTLNL
ncbi:MAG: helix-turn-helix domain-containing protein [Deltaproteobacteria bacterium]|nr:helix-turn-helix domain-containing protein [Deltaproteobacteria bacterium]